MPHDLWHFPRPALAEECLSSFAIGLIAARAFVSPSGTGKTEFLQQDLLPAARAAGYQTAYVDLAQDRQNMEDALAAALAGAIAGVPPSGDLAVPVALTSVIRLLDSTQHPLLLVVDETQELSLAEHSTFAHALRSHLDIRKDFIKVVFAGKVAPLMHRVFSESSAPFYHWCSLEQFPLLGVEFVEAMVAKVADLSRYPLSMREALMAFEALDKAPAYYRRFLERYLTHASEGAAAALDVTKKAIFQNFVYLFRWEKFLPADQLVLEVLATGEKDMYSVPVRKRIGQKLGLDIAPTSTVQNSLTRLRKAGHVIAVTRGEYHIEDAAFLRWIAEREQGAQPSAQPGQPEAVQA